jgi:cell division FtsZ-interacting protein ZapD
MYLAEKIGQSLRDDYYLTIVNKDIPFFDGCKTGDISKCPPA